MSFKRGDNTLRVCQQHLLGQVDDALNEKEGRGNIQEREREREKRRKEERTINKVE